MTQYKLNQVLKMPALSLMVRCSEKHLDAGLLWIPNKYPHHAHINIIIKVE